jgi:hypothetical protein
MKERKQLLLAGVQPTSGLKATLTAQDNAIATGLVKVRVGTTLIDRIAVRRSLAKLKKEVGKKMLTFSFSVEMKGSGDPIKPPEFAPLLECCAMKKTIGSTQVEFSPEADEDQMKISTLEFFQDGFYFRAIDCVGNVKKSYPPGQFGRLDFEIQGKFESVGDEALPANPAFQATVPVRIQSAGLKFGAFASPVARSFEFNSGNTIGEREDINSPDGFKAPEVTERAPTWAAVIESVKEATSPFWADWLARATRAIPITVGTQAGNIVTLEIPLASIDDVQLGSSNGRSTWEMNGACNESVDDAADDYKIIFK